MNHDDSDSGDDDDDDDDDDSNCDVHLLWTAIVAETY